MDRIVDVIVVGAGNAALCAALAARQRGARVLVLERAPQEHRGGNSAHTGGAFRVRYDGLDDILKLVPDLTEDEISSSDFGAYTAETYFDDLASLSRYRVDPDLADILVDESLPTLEWMCQLGVRFVPIYGRQAFKVDGKFKFWGGLIVEASGGGAGLVASLNTAAEASGIEILYNARAISLLQDDDGNISGLNYTLDGKPRTAHAPNVILASGGFHANAEWRARYLGQNWDLAKVRGSRFNTGDGIRMAIDIGAVSAGHWSGCHSVGYDVAAPEFGELDLLNQQKNSFWLGIMVNSEGKRFVDEGADFRNYIYSQMGRWILQQPGATAWQVFDSKVVDMLTDEYRIRQITKVQANTIEDLAVKMEGVDAEGFVNTIKTYNASLENNVPFNPSIKDGKSTNGLAVKKSNWANPIDTPPYYAFGVTTGITFTYGGLRINANAQVLTSEGSPIGGLYAAGELVGGLYYHDYPGGAGLTSGSVFGRKAGYHATRSLPSTA